LSGASPGAAVRVRGLEPGDLIGVAATAGPAEHEPLARGVAELVRLGYRVRLAPGVADRRGYLAGDDASRAAALNGLIADPEVRGLLFARGGYGTGRILERIDLDGLRRDPRLIIGFSDLTALMMALQHGGDYPVGYGPQVSDLARPRRYQARSFRRFLAEGPQRGSIDLDGCEVVAHGDVTGTLRGGCLTLLQTLVGTPWEPDLRGAILFWEDWREEPYRIDRMLNHLRSAGRLAGIRGMVVGKPVQIRPRGEQSSLALQEILLDHAGSLGVPIVLGLPAGHCPAKITLPLGVPAHLDTRAGILEILPD